MAKKSKYIRSQPNNYINSSKSYSAAKFDRKIININETAQLLVRQRNKTTLPRSAQHRYHGNPLSIDGQQLMTTNTLAD